MKTALRLSSMTLALIFASAGCTTEEKPDAFVHAAIKAVKGEPQALWASLPASYQTDVKGLLAQFATQMDEKVWNDGFALANKAIQVLETKKEFVRNHPQVKGMTTPEDFDQGYDPVVKIVKTIISSDIHKLEQVKSLDVDAFLSGPIASIMDDLFEAGEVAAAKASRPGTPDIKGMRAKLDSVKITVDSVDGDTAKVTVEADGQPKETHDFVKVEGKWIPKALADGWKPAIASAQMTLAAVKLDPPTINKFNAMKGMMDGVLDGMLAAETQEAFNTQVAGAMQTVGGRRGPPTAAMQGDIAVPDKGAPTKKTKKKRKGRKKRRK